MRGTWIAIVLVAALGGCDSSAGGLNRHGPVVHPQWRSCAVEYTPDAPGDDMFAQFMTLLRDTDFKPVTGIACAHVEQRRPDGGVDLVETESRIDDLDGLLRVLNLPDERRRPGTACTDGAPTPEWIVVVDRDGRWLRPGLPARPCWTPRAEVYDVLPTLPRTVTGSRVIREVLPAGTVETGCAQRAYNHLVVDPPPAGTVEPSSAPPANVAHPADVCVYRQDPTGPYGTFTTGVRRRDPWPAELYRLIQAAPEPLPCRERATRFAVLWLRDAYGISATTFELDGCTRFYRTVGNPRQGDQAILALLQVGG